MSQVARPKHLAEFGEVLMPQEAEEPILARPVRAALIEWLTEIWAAEELEEAGLKPRRKAMFHGAPGTGKTTLAHHLAARLGLPLAVIRPDRLIECWLGASERNVGALFDAAKREPVVLFFDEFEAIGAARVAGARDAQRAMTSVVDVLLQRFDAHDGFVIAATNHGGEIDPALWRRFDLQIALDLPGQEERERILARYLAPWGLPARALSGLAIACETASPALLRQLCEGIKRNLVIGPKLGWAMTREAVVGRVIASIEPHASLGKPRLWSLGVADVSVAALPWPLPRADAIPPEEAPASPDLKPGVVPFPARKGA